MIILGIDPGTAITGYGAVKTPAFAEASAGRQNSKARKAPWASGFYGVKSQKLIKCLGYGSIKTDSSWLPQKRLQKIYREMSSLLSKYKPRVLAVESVYFFKNAKTAMPVSQARGVILLAAAQKNVPVYECTPLQIKMAVAGYGNAGKMQVQKMIKLVLRLQELPRPDDAADALGAALCYIYSQGALGPRNTRGA